MLYTRSIHAAALVAEQLIYELGKDVPSGASFIGDSEKWVMCASR